MMISFRGHWGLFHSNTGDSLTINQSEHTNNYDDLLSGETLDLLFSILHVILQISLIGEANPISLDFRMQMLTALV